MPAQHCALPQPDWCIAATHQPPSDKKLQQQPHDLPHQLMSWRKTVMYDDNLASKKACKSPKTYLG
jgi:hypothetical protein